MSQAPDLEDVKVRVEAVDPNKGRCLVENNPNNSDVEYCYVLPRRVMHNDNLIDSLEWSWKLRKGTLNLDTRYNIFPASSRITRLFQTAKFILVPDDEVIDMYEDCLYPSATRLGITRRDRFDVIENGTYNYQLIPIEDMEDITFLRQESSSKSSIHKYPFDTLPKLASHIHPKFVIAAIGERLFDEECKALREIYFSEQYPILTRIKMIYDLWSARYPGVAEEDPTFFPEYFLAADPGRFDTDDSASVRTEKGRGYERQIPSTPGSITTRRLIL